FGYFSSNLASNPSVSNIAFSMIQSLSGSVKFSIIEGLESIPDNKVADIFSRLDNPIESGSPELSPSNGNAGLSLFSMIKILLLGQTNFYFPFPLWQLSPFQLHLPLKAPVRCFQSPLVRLFLPHGHQMIDFLCSLFVGLRAFVILVVHKQTGRCHRLWK